MSTIITLASRARRRVTVSAVPRWLGALRVGGAGRDRDPGRGRGPGAGGGRPQGGGIGPGVERVRDGRRRRRVDRPADRRVPDVGAAGQRRRAGRDRVVADAGLRPVAGRAGRGREPVRAGRGMDAGSAVGGHRRRGARVPGLGRLLRLRFQPADGTGGLPAAGRDVRQEPGQHPASARRGGAAVPVHADLPGRHDRPVRRQREPDRADRPVRQRDRPDLAAVRLMVAAHLGDRQLRPGDQVRLRQRRGDGDRAGERGGDRRHEHARTSPRAAWWDSPTPWARRPASATAR